LAVKANQLMQAMPAFFAERRKRMAEWLKTWFQ
jgi:hypothetical protein